jgi:hypothetical protein
MTCIHLTGSRQRALFMFAAGFMLAGSPALAQESGLLGPGYWRVAGSPYSQHFRPSDEHKHVYAIALERQRSDDWLAGASYFRNSFGQPSAYLYVGKRFPALFGHEQLYGQVSGGLLYGYRGKYEDKVPFNNNGFSPGALVTLGWQLNRQWAVSAHLLGDAAVMFQLSYDLR